jgi:hypothetical protein
MAFETHSLPSKRDPLDLEPEPLLASGLARERDPTARRDDAVPRQPFGPLQRPDGHPRGARTPGRRRHDPVGRDLPSRDAADHPPEGFPARGGGGPSPRIPHGTRPPRGSAACMATRRISSPNACCDRAHGPTVILAQDLPHPASRTRPRSVSTVLRAAARSPRSSRGVGSGLFRLRTGAARDPGFLRNTGATATPPDRGGVLLDEAARPGSRARHSAPVPRERSPPRRRPKSSGATRGPAVGGALLLRGGPVRELALLRRFGDRVHGVEGAGRRASSSLPFLNQPAALIAAQAPRPATGLR